MKKYTPKRKLVNPEKSIDDVAHQRKIFANIVENMKVFYFLKKN